MSRTAWICEGIRTAARSSFSLPHIRNFSRNSRYLKISEEVQQAISERRPVVALETTIYTHGFPYPDNLSLASRLESLVRINGGVPATIGILNGVAHVGMGADELMQLVSTGGSPNTLKISRRDLGFACGLKAADGKPFNGGTTIAGTMILAHLAGIKVFATGGLGGVHRGAEQTFDISADLTELGRTPVAVVSSGCKSFLDIAKTIEYLETQGVAVATFADGRNGAVDFPGFWTRESGVPSPKTIQTESEAANVIHAHTSFGLQSGFVFGNPIPEQHSLPLRDMEIAITQATEEAQKDGAVGAANTPYILSKIKELTSGKTVESNRALVENNVVRGTKVAVELSRLEQADADCRHDTSHTGRGSQMVGPAAMNYTQDGVTIGISSSVNNTASSTTTRAVSHPPCTPSPRAQAIEASQADVIVAGSLAVDLSCDYAPQSQSASPSPEQGTSNPAVIAQSLGGVGHNVARAAHLMGAGVRLCSAVGDDIAGKAALEALAANGMTDDAVRILPQDGRSRTAQYVAVNDKQKDLVLAMADMSILEETSTLGPVSQSFDELWLPQLQSSRPSVLAIDGNWPSPHLARWLTAGKDTGSLIVFEPVSNAKSRRIFQPAKDQNLAVFPSPSIHLATPNQYELAAMHDAARESGALDRQDWWAVIDALGIPSTGARTQLALATNARLVDQGIPQQSIQLLPFIPSICTKLGSEGVLLTQLLPANDERLTSGNYAPYILSRCANGTEDSLGVGGVYMRLFSPAEEVEAADVVSVNGVGDTFVGTLIAGLAKGGKDSRVEDFVDLAQRAAVLTLKSKESVSPGLGTLRLLL